MLHWGNPAKRLSEEGRHARDDERGFTLIELLVVIIIIGILAAIAIPTFLGQRDRAQDSQAVSMARNYATAAKTWLIDQPANADYCSADFTQANVQAIESSLVANLDGAGAITVASAGPSDCDDFVITVPSPAGGNAVFESAAGQVSGP